LTFAKAIGEAGKENKKEREKEGMRKNIEERGKIQKNVN
jgi:hypothetical protein